MLRIQMSIVDLGGLDEEVAFYEKFRLFLGYTVPSVKAEVIDDDEQTIIAVWNVSRSAPVEAP